MIFAHGHLCSYSSNDIPPLLLWLGILQDIVNKPQTTPYKCGQIIPLTYTHTNISYKLITNVSYILYIASWVNTQ